LAVLRTDSLFFVKEMKKVISITIILLIASCFPANAQIKTVSGEHIGRQDGVEKLKSFSNFF